MRRRPLPSPEEARAILAQKRTRPIHRSAKPLGAALGPYLKGVESRFGAGPLLQARWREIAGDVLARRTQPVRVLKGRGGAPGVLEVRADGAVATVIQHQADPILERVNLFLGVGTVGKLRIVQGLVRAPPAGATKGEAVSAKAVRRNMPLSAAQEAGLAQGLSEAADGPLKTALERLGRAVLRRSDREPSR